MEGEKGPCREGRKRDEVPRCDLKSSVGPPYLKRVIPLDLPWNSKN